MRIIAWVAGTVGVISLSLVIWATVWLAQEGRLGNEKTMGGVCGCSCNRRGGGVGVGGSGGVGGKVD